jgi:SAM-dependent methyltransferase
MQGPTGYQEELQTIYSNRFSASEQYRNKVWRTLIEHWFQKLIPPDASVLDLGCGFGQFINNVRCGKKYAMDLNPTAKQKLDPSVQFLMQDCSTAWDLPESSLDIVFTSNFFEHLFSKTDLKNTISQVKRCLKPGGRIIAMGPNIKYVPGAYWDFFDHYLALTELSLKEAFDTGGLHTTTAIDRFLPYTMVNAPEYPVAFMRLYLAIPLAWKVMGKQFLVIAEK